MGDRPEGSILDCFTSHRFDPLSAVLLADDDGRVLGAAVHHPACAFPGTQYISALMIDHRRRGQGLGREFFVAVLADARERSGKRYVIWTAHPQNKSMIARSRSLVRRQEGVWNRAKFWPPHFTDPARILIS
jgi:GNAT superfamily N-acetyltransferase